MSFDWKQYLTLAEHIAPSLASRVPNKTILPALGTEAKLRTSISRAYYSAFSCARAYLESSTGASYRFPGAHTEVRNRFRSMSSRQARQIGADLARLYEDRKKADYDDAVNGLDSTTELALITAHDIIIAVETLT